MTGVQTCALPIFCKAAAAQYEGKPAKLGAPFYPRGSRIEAGGAVMELDYSDVDGPPLHPNCRCDMEPVLESDDE